LLSLNNNSTRYAANLQTAQTPDSVITPKLDGFTGFVDQWLAEDFCRKRKQRHTTKRVFERLRDEHGFKGSYTTVKNYVREYSRRSREMFVPLAHAPRCAAAYGRGLSTV